jgi:molybdate transport system regulatory protein
VAVSVLTAVFLAIFGVFGGKPLCAVTGACYVRRRWYTWRGTMADIGLSIRLDLTSRDSIGPGKIALLESIRSEGSISAAARQLGMSYRRAWLLVEQINNSLSEPAVTAATGGASGGGAALTPVGEQVIDLYRTIESLTRSSANGEFRALRKLIRRGKPGA